MKKIVCGFVLALCVASYGQGVNETYFNDFLADESVQKMLGHPLLPPNLAGLLDPSVFYVRFQEDEKKPMGYIPLYENEKLLGVIHFAKVNTELFSTVNGSPYVVAWRDYRNVIQEKESLNGIVHIYDLNYDGLEFQRVEIGESRILDWVDTDIEKEMKIHPCDENANGNVGFRECYRCMRKACQGDPECDFLCDMINLRFKLCKVSMKLACIYIAAKY